MKNDCLRKCVDFIREINGMGAAIGMEVHEGGNHLQEAIDWLFELRPVLIEACPASLTKTREIVPVFDHAEPRFDQYVHNHVGILIIIRGDIMHAVINIRGESFDPTTDFKLSIPVSELEDIYGLLIC